MKKGIFTLYIKNNKNEETKLRDFKTKKEAEDFATILIPLYRQVGAKNHKLFIKYEPGNILVSDFAI